jgi:hypothetical protein
MTRSRKQTHLPTNAMAHSYQYLSPALSSLYLEIKDLSKKKPDGIVTPYKLRLVNKTLSDIKQLLPVDPALSHVDVFSEDDLPQYSDLILVLGQFQAVRARFKAKFYRYDRDRSGSRWVTQEDPSDVDDEFEKEE